MKLNKLYQKLYSQSIQLKGYFALENKIISHKIFLHIDIMIYFECLGVVTLCFASLRHRQMNICNKFERNFLSPTQSCVSTLT